MKEKDGLPQEWSREELLEEFLKLKAEYKKLLKETREENEKRIAMYQQQIRDRRQGY